jgi:hypothetical protein
MALPVTSIMKAVYNRRVAWEIMDSPNYRRTAFVHIGNSNTRYNDAGHIRDFQRSKTPLLKFGSGVHAALHGVSTDFGGDLEERRASEGTGAYGSGSTQGYTVFIPIVTFATYTHASKSVTQTGAFSNYDIAQGTKFVVTSCNGNGVTGTYTIASKTNNDTVVLTQSVGSTCTQVAGYIEHDLLPAWVRKLNRFPVAEPATSAGAAAWGPTCNGVFWYPSGRTGGFWSPASHNIRRRHAHLPVNNKLVYSLMQARSTTPGGSAQIRAAYTAFGTVSPGTLIGTTSLNVVTQGSADGEINFVRFGGIAGGAAHGFNVKANRVTTAPAASSRDAVTFTIGTTAALVGPFCPLYYHVCDEDNNTGWSVQCMMSAGGMPRYHMANILLGNGFIADSIEMNATVELYLRAVLDQFHIATGGDGTGMVVFCIRDIFNALSSSLTANSLGPSPAPSNTPAGNTDNFKALRNYLLARINSAATTGGYSIGDNGVRVRFIIEGEHCLSDSPTPGTPPDYSTNANNEQWRRLMVASDGAFAETTTDTCVLDYGGVATNAELVQYGFLVDPTITTGDLRADDRHLASPGYTYLNDRMDSAIMAFPTAAAAALGSLGGITDRRVR